MLHLFYSILLPRDLVHPTVRVITMVLFFCWPVVTMVYYGISYSAEKIDLTEDVFLRCSGLIFFLSLTNPNAILSIISKKW